MDPYCDHTRAGTAAATGWSESTVARRIEALRAADLLFFDFDVDDRLLGFHAHTRMWLTVPPAHLLEAGRAIAAHPEVAFCAATTGRANLPRRWCAGTRPTSSAT